MSFVFFTSYARDNKTHYLEKFVRELSQQVLDKTNFPPEQIGFFDGSNIETGQDWVRVLGDALRTCKVIVCLCTPRSLNSQFCGKEMQVFLLRRENWLQQPGNENKRSWDRLPGHMGAAGRRAAEGAREVPVHRQCAAQEVCGEGPERVVSGLA